MNKVVSTCVETLVHFKNFALLYSRVGAEPEPHQNFCPEPEPQKLCRSATLVLQESPEFSVTCMRATNARRLSYSGCAVYAATGYPPHMISSLFFAVN
jgi:hypothetical protein